MPRPFPISLAVVLFLCSVTVWFFKFHDRYEYTGPELIDDPRFQQGFSRWKHAGEIALLPQTGEAALTNPAFTGTTHLTQAITGLRQHDQLMLSGSLRISDVRTGNAYWKKARIVLTFHDNSGKGMYYLPHVLVEKTGDSGWGRYKRVFRVPGDAVEARVSVQLPETTGNMAVRDLSLRTVAETPSFRRYRLVLMAAWLLALGWIAGGIIRRKTSLLRRPVLVLAVAVVILGALLPSQIKSVLDRHIQQTATRVYAPEGKATDKPEATPPEQHFALPVSPIFVTYKAGHVLMFALLSFLAFRLKPPELPAWQLSAGLLVFAFSTEALQFFVEGREARWNDLAIDSAGILMGTAAWQLRKFRQRQH